MWCTGSAVMIGNDMELRADADALARMPRFTQVFCSFDAQLALLLRHGFQRLRCAQIVGTAGMREHAAFQVSIGLWSWRSTAATCNSIGSLGSLPERWRSVSPSMSSPASGAGCDSIIRPLVTPNASSSKWGCLTYDVVCVMLSPWSLTRPRAGMNVGRDRLLSNLRHVRRLGALQGTYRRRHRAVIASVAISFTQSGAGAGLGSRDYYLPARGKLAYLRR